MFFMQKIQYLSAFIYDNNDHSGNKMTCKSCYHIEKTSEKSQQSN
jgi:hypothetical protein